MRPVAVVRIQLVARLFVTALPRVVEAPGAVAAPGPRELLVRVVPGVTEVAMPLEAAVAPQGTERMRQERTKVAMEGLESSGLLVRASTTVVVAVAVGQSVVWAPGALAVVALVPTREQRGVVARRGMARTVVAAAAAVGRRPSLDLGVATVATASSSSGT